MIITLDQLIAHYTHTRLMQFTHYETVLHSLTMKRAGPKTQIALKDAKLASHNDWHIFKLQSLDLSLAKSEELTPGAWWNLYKDLKIVITTRDRYYIDHYANNASSAKIINADYSSIYLMLLLSLFTDYISSDLYRRLIPSELIIEYMPGKVSCTKYTWTFINQDKSWEDLKDQEITSRTAVLREAFTKVIQKLWESQKKVWLEGKVTVQYQKSEFQKLYIDSRIREKDDLYKPYFEVTYTIHGQSLLVV